MMTCFPGPRRIAASALFAALALAATIATDAAADTRVIVINSADDSISLIDPRTYAETARVPIGREPHHLMPTPDGRDLLVANAAGNELVVTDPRTGAIRKRLPGIPDPYQLAYSPDRRWFVTAGLRLNRIDVYEADGLKPVKRLPIDSMPSHIAFTPDSKLACRAATRSPRSTSPCRLSPGRCRSASSPPGCS